MKFKSLIPFIFSVIFLASCGGGSGGLCVFHLTGRAAGGTA